MTLGGLEVRRCARCGEAAAICERDIDGIGAVRPFCCQRCGATFTIVDPRRVRLVAAVGLALLPTIVVPLVAFAWVARRLLVARAHPIVPFAPLPPLRFRDGRRIPRNP